MMSIEAFIGINLMMNLLILGITSRCVGHMRWRRVLLAALIGTGYAAAAYLLNAQWLQSVGAQAVCLLLMAFIVLGRRYGRSWSGYAHLLGSVIFAGGIMTLLSRWIPPGSALLTATGWVCMVAAAILGSGIRESGNPSGRVHLRLSTRMGSVEMEALIDTGNRLKEPLSGLPVLIVRRSMLRGLLDPSCLEKTGKRLPPGFRLVRYSVIGGMGEMTCFRPASVCIWQYGEWRETADLWVGICQDEMPADVDALAPAILKATPHK